MDGAVCGPDPHGDTPYHPGVTSLMPHEDRHKHICQTYALLPPNTWTHMVYEDTHTWDIREM